MRFIQFLILLFYICCIYTVRDVSAKTTKKLNKPITKKLNCSKIFRFVFHKEKRTRLKNRLVFCDGIFSSSMLVKDSFSILPKSFHPWIKKSKKQYIFHVTTQQKKKRPLHFYLLSNDEESKAVLAKGTKVEFSGQIIQHPVFLEGHWHFLLLREETAVKIE